MSLRALLLIALLPLSPVLAQDAAMEEPAPAAEESPAAGNGLDTQEQQVSYALGLMMGKNLTQQGISLDVDAHAHGLRDGLTGAEPLMTEDEVEKTMVTFQMSMQEQFAKKMAEEAEQNIEAGTAFLEKNKAKEGVVTLPSGLQYEVLAEGEGDKPSETDTVKVHYTGTLVDGTVFDSSVERGQPVVFPVNRVIPGWTEALQLMSPGDKWHLVIPSDLAYGEGGHPPKIGPNSVLQFDVELLEVNPEPEGPSGS